MAKKKPKSGNTTKPSFEEALGRLEQIVGRLDEGEIGLNEALEEYEQGVKLLRHCYEMLEGAQRRIELLSGVDADGNPLTEPLDDELLSLDEKARSRSRRRGGSNTDDPPDSGGHRDDIDMDVSEGLF